MFDPFDEIESFDNTKKEKSIDEKTKAYVDRLILSQNYVFCSLYVLLILAFGVFFFYIVYDAIKTESNQDDIDHLIKKCKEMSNVPNGNTTMLGVVYIPIESLESVGGGTYIAHFGSPENIIGNFSSSIEISSSGKGITTSEDVFQIVTEINTQYSSQGSGSNSRRTFHSIFYDGIGIDGSASGIPVPSNGWRVTANYVSFNLMSGQEMTISLNSNAQGVVTLNSGSVTIIYI